MRENKRWRKKRGRKRKWEGEEKDKERGGCRGREDEGNRVKSIRLNYSIQERTGNVYDNMNLLLVNFMLANIVTVSAYIKFMREWSILFREIGRPAYVTMASSCRGVTPIDSIVTAVTTGQNFDQLFSMFDH